MKKLKGSLEIKKSCYSKIFNILVATLFIFQQVFIVSPKAFADYAEVMDPNLPSLPREVDPSFVDAHEQENEPNTSHNTLDQMMDSDFPLYDDEHVHTATCGHFHGEPSDGPELHIYPTLDFERLRENENFFADNPLSEPTEEVREETSPVVNTSVLPTLKTGDSFYLDESPLSAATPDSTFTPSSQVVSFREALESGELREDYASAVLLQEPFLLEDLEALRNAEFEIAVGVIEGQLVAFTSGQTHEISMTSEAYRFLKDSATFYIHNHPESFAGPSESDLVKAIDDPYMEYVIDNNVVYAYNKSGEHGMVSELKLLENLNASLAEVSVDEVAAREALNFFITEQDRFNEAHEVEKTLFRGESSLVTPLNSKFIYLNFHGQHFNRWGGYSNVALGAYDRDGDLSNFSTSELNMLDLIISGMKDKFSPFNLEVFTSFEYTNDEVTYGAAKGLEVVIGSGTSSFLGGAAGGVAYLNSWKTYNSFAHSVLVFEDNLANGYAKYVLDAGAHEVGHAFGLHHSSDYNASGGLLSSYHTGDGHAAPTMGVGYYSDFTLWANNPAYNPNVMQDDLSFLASTYNEVGYRADDHSNTFADATILSNQGEQFITDSGIIEQIDDQDFYLFSTAAGDVTVNVDTMDLGMLDPKVSVYDSFGRLVESRDVVGHDETLTLSLTAGDYYVVVESTGTYTYDSVINGQGYHLGMYDLNVTVPVGSPSQPNPNNPPPTPNASLHNFTAHGNASIDTTEPVFGQASLKLDGTGDYLSLEDSEDWAMGTDDFTIDFRLKFNSLDSIQTFFSMNGANDIAIAKDGANRMLVMMGGSVMTQTAWNPPLDTWMHIALTRSNGQVRIFVDGVQIGSTKVSRHNISREGAINIGRSTNGNRNFNGWIDEFRISKGEARWTSNFTLPTEEYARDESTSLLLHFTEEEFSTGAEVDDTDPTVIAPRGTVSINGGGNSTGDVNATLTLSVVDNTTAEEAMEMAISVDGGETFGNFENFAVTKEVILPSEEGVKTVVVRYRDEDGNVADFLDTIHLDESAPVGSVLIKGGDSLTNSRTVTLNLDVSDAVSSSDQIKMAISVDGGTTFSSFESYATSKDVLLPSGEGIKTVVVRYQDEVGNVSEVSDVITLDQTAPTGNVSINSGAATTEISRVTLALNASDSVSSSNVIQMAVSVDGGTTFSDYENFSNSKVVTLSSGNGVKTVVVRYRDEAGNVSEFSDTIDVQIPLPPFTPKNFTSHGDTLIDSSEAVFGPSSVKFDGLGDYIALENNSDWAMGTNDFTIDFRLKFNNLDSIQTFFSMNGASDLAIAKDGANRMLVMMGGSVITQTAWNVQKDTWMHIAVTRENNQVRVFVNGSQVGSTTTSMHDFRSSGIAHIGQWTNGHRGFNGAMDEFRVSKGVARWTSDFTPTVTEHTRDDETSLLLHFTEEEFSLGAEANDDPTTVAPVGTVSINEGATVTSNTNLTLSLSASDNLSAESALEMAVSVDGGTTFSAFESFVASKDVTLQAGDGMKTVVVRYRDEDGNVAEFSDTIILDQTAPAGNVSIDAGDSVTNSTNVTLSLNASDVVSSTIQVSISVNDGITYTSYADFLSSINVTLPAGEGTKRVYVRYRDEVGNVSEFSDSIVLDQTPPTGSIDINSGAATTDSRDVTLALTTSDTISNESSIQMAFSVDGGATFSAFESFQSSKAVTLPSGNGIKTVVVRYRDEAGNVAEFNDAIDLQTTEPDFTAKNFSVNGDSSIDASESLLGGSSIKFDGEGDSLRLENSSDWAMGTNDFTIDFRVKFNDLGSVQTMFSMNGASDIAIEKDGANRMLFSMGGKTMTQTAWNPPLNTWTHIALVRSGEDVRLFIDGVQLGPVMKSTHNISRTGNIDLGRSSNGARGFNGWMDEFRISKGVARWTSDFAPPTAEYTRDENTSLLLHFTEEELATGSEI